MRMNKEQTIDTDVDYLTIDTTEYKYHLLIDDGVYYADSVWGLFTEVITHRWFHLKRGEGWVD